MNSYLDFLRIGDEIDLDSLAAEVELTMMINERLIDNYDESTAQKKIFELMNLISRLQELKNYAMAHSSYTVFDKCEIYIIEIEQQMNKLRDIYMR